MTSDRISALHENNPRIQSYIRDLRIQRKEVEQTIHKVQAQVNAVVDQSETLKCIQEERVRRSRTQGRISSFIETKDLNEGPDLENDASVLSYQIDKLEERLSGETFEDRLYNASATLSDFMTEYAKLLDLEHSEGRTRLDIKNLTVVADTPGGPIRLRNMGSGDNWVGCHVIAHAALHRWFRLKDRPVPAFLILDQPSKAHYPPDEDQLEAAIDDDDTVAVVRLFQFLYKRAANDDFQIIVVDHADEADSWFQESVIERWRGGLKLVPDAWGEG